MKLFAPETPLLRSVVLAIRATGGPAMHGVTRSEGREQLGVSWFPTLPHGVLVYCSDTESWGQEEVACEDKNLMVHISGDGHLMIGPGDDDPIWIDTSIRAGDELDELLEFYSTARASLIGSSASSQRRLSQLIEEVFLLVSQGEKEHAVVPLRGQSLAMSHPKIADFLEAWLSYNWNLIVAYGESDFGSWLDKNDLRQALGAPQELRLGDLILTGGGGVYFAGMLMVGAESNLGFAPALVLRPNADTSRLWLSDYFEHAIEAEGLVERICKGWRHLPKGLNNITVVAPAAKRDQVANAIAGRTARYAYIGHLRSAMRMREPFESLAATYRKRSRAALGLNTELLDDLVAIQRPLPFFLEYPYRCFRREDDRLERTHGGQRLLGVLTKVPLYLVVEELLNNGHAIGKEMLEEIEERPLSDGALVDLQKSLGRLLSEQQESPLKVFRQLAGLMVETRFLDDMVSARNRMHHEPYDEDGFLDAMSAGASRVIDALREALGDCRFLVPQHCRVVGSKKLVVAEDVCSADAHFRRVELPVTLPLESFPSDTLIAWTQQPETALRLGRLVTCKLVSHQSRDFGIFDRVQKNERHFMFLRSG